MKLFAPSLMTGLLLCGLAASCGFSDYNPDTQGDDALEPATPVQPTPQVPNLPETFIIGADRIGKVVAAESLPLYFRSDDAAATFECRQDARMSFQACPEGDAWFFQGLVQGGLYRMEVRARNAQGLVDATPATIEFRVDRQEGKLPYDGGQSVLTIEKPADLPSASATAGGNRSRRLQLGSFYVADVPLDMTAVSYSTTRTLNSKIHIMSTIDPDRPAGAGAEGCRRDWERIVYGPNRALFCDATPTREEMQSYARPLPLNHVELLGEQGGVAYEKVMLAAFEEEGDATEMTSNLQSACAASVVHGSSPMQILNGQLDRSPGGQIVRWCRVVNGASAWWLGLVEGRLGQHQKAVRLKIIYAISETRGVKTPQQFAARIQGYVPRLVQHLAPLP